MVETYEIHPSIGIARVGNSEHYFIGPEPDGGPPRSHRDAQGKLLRQAARFRLFRCLRSAAGNLTEASEIKADDMEELTWSIHVANRKGVAQRLHGSGRRNEATGDDKQDRDLIIDPGEQSVSLGGTESVALNQGKFRNETVGLGGIRLEQSGRLVFCGGSGESKSIPAHGPGEDLDFADNDDWHDTTCDGIVRAAVRLKGRQDLIRPLPSWVIAGPPDFAPAIENIVTLYDTMMQVAVDRGFRSKPARTSFSRHIQPILMRAAGYQWVNQPNRAGHSGPRRGDFARRFADLAKNDPPPWEAKILLERLRDPRTDPASQPAEPDRRRWMPRLHDETDNWPVLPLTILQYEALLDWAAGSFDSDYGQDPPPEKLPDALDRMALQACAGAPFYPGIECWRIVRDRDIYMDAFRLDPAHLKPGQFTEGNAVPWQADFFDCRWDPDRWIGWWPAQRPDHVLVSPDTAYSIPWARGVEGEREMVDKWHQLGFVVPTQAPDGSTVFVESQRSLP
ncbi:MAG: LodA/GoxA family CTQ-dependent oxidase [Verrucomicrobia bacterium]|nr:LodA/GoxA family CTQ-dependent oxidase [Verrucomicrobiota bacterium]